MKNKDMFKELVDIFQLMDILNKNGFEKEYGKLNINGVPSGKRGFTTLRKLKN